MPERTEKGDQERKMVIGWFLLGEVASPSLVQIHSPSEKKRGGMQKLLRSGEGLRGSSGCWGKSVSFILLLFK